MTMRYALATLFLMLATVAPLAVFASLAREMYSSAAWAFVVFACSCYQFTAVVTEIAKEQRHP